MATPLESLDSPVVTATPISTTVDVSALLDAARFGPMQGLVLTFCFLVLVMDGFDIQAIAFVAPALTETWGISRSALGPVLAAALLGMAVGAAGIGPLGDRYGRKNALVLTCVLMAVGSSCSAIASSPLELAVFRFITGLGLGGAMPNATALMFEFAPKQWRQMATSFALIGVPLGGVVGAVIARWMIPELGWQSLFVVGGVIPGLLAIVMWFGLPESPRYLSGRADQTSRLAKLLNRIVGEPRFLASSKFVGGGAAQSSSSAIAAIFAKEFRRDTLFLWAILFTNVFAVYFFWSWLPTVLAAANLDFQISVTGPLYFNLGGIAGALFTSALIGRHGSRRVLIPVGLCAIVSVILIGANPLFSPGPQTAGTGALMWTMAAAGACINALQIGMFSVTAHAYPTFCRATGVGWALAVARFGGILSSFAGAAFFASGMQPRNFFFAVATVLTLTLMSVICLRRHIPAIYPAHREAP
jgi:AAHS family 4-hydroxybenzoate transporter-like MFS transporter